MFVNFQTELVVQRFQYRIVTVQLWVYLRNVFIGKLFHIYPSFPFLFFFFGFFFFHFKEIKFTQMTLLTKKTVALFSLVRL